MPLTSSRRLYLVHAEVPIHDRAEDEREGVVVKLEEAQDIEVAEKSRGDVVASPTRRAHGTDQDCIDDILPCHVLEVVPAGDGDGHDRSNANDPRSK